MQDMEAILSLEIKKEMADRYFGFRKMIEDDSQRYHRHIRETYRQLEDCVGCDLIRLYILLRQEALIHDFFRLTGLRDQTFFDPYLLHAKAIRQQLFNGQRCHGLTRRTRFQNLFLDIYNRLIPGVETYRATLNQLMDEGRTIAQRADHCSGD